MITLVIGRESNLSKHIFTSLDNVVLLSSRKLTDNINLLDTYKNDKINIIFNNFQSATLLSNLENAKSYIEQSIGITSAILDHIKSWKINKLMYTSSSSVYGNNNHCSESNEIHPMSLHASLKIANEFLISQYCKKHKINYTVMRIFNMFGGDDRFSIISKIILSYTEKKVLNIVNEGKGIRDYIYIEDVVYIIIKLLKIRDIPIINVGSGNKKSLKSILENLKVHEIDIKINNIVKDNEIQISVSDNKNIMKIMDRKFVNVEDYILKEIKS